MFCLANCCRLCLSNDSTVVEYNYSAIDNFSYINKLISITPKLELDAEIYFPKGICKQCQKQKDQLDNFIEECIKSKKLLTTYINQLKNSTNNKVTPPFTNSFKIEEETLTGTPIPTSTIKTIFIKEEIDIEETPVLGIPVGTFIKQEEIEFHDETHKSGVSKQLKTDQSQNKFNNLNKKSEANSEIFVPTSTKSVIINDPTIAFQHCHMDIPPSDATSFVPDSDNSTKENIFQDSDISIYFHSDRDLDFQPGKKEYAKIQNSESDNILKSEILFNQSSHKVELQESFILKNKTNISTKSNKTEACLNAGRKRIRQKDFCYFCDQFVLNFARHLQRNHLTEIEVQRCFLKPIGSKERKDLLCLLRRKSNFLNTNKCVKPVKKPNIPHGEFLPCVHCLGFYSKKQLSRHAKKCIQNPNTTTTRYSLAEAQNILIRHLKIDPQLRTNVFPRMRADYISLVAKKDPLICAFGARYIKIHRDKYFVSVASRKMRELAKLLIEIKKMEPNISTLFLALNPVYFDIIVAATKKVAKYNEAKNLFQSPTYAMNIGTVLKQCCDIAIIFALKKKEVFATIQAGEAEANLKTMIELLKSNWKFEISSEAADDLNSKKWNKIKIVPLTTDLKKMNEYLISQANKAGANLINNSRDVVTYVKLLECIYCRVILLNRNSPSELQRLPLHIYEKSELDKAENDEDFANTISPTETILMKRFKRIVIRGKRGRGVLVLFSVDVQAHIQTLLKFRNNFVPKSNLYLFGKPNLDTPIYGYKILQKHAAACGAKHPTAITSTKLRKHLATITQIFNLNLNEIEQLATFMDHTDSSHMKAYRLPDDKYQTAKISKLLMLMEKGTASQFKGKFLDQIDLNLEENLLDVDQKECYESKAEFQNEDYEIADLNKPSSSKMIEKINSNKPKMLTRQKRELTPWTIEQKNVVCNYFKAHIVKRKPPKKAECDALIAENPQLFSNKNWLKMKVFVQNKYTKS